MTDAERAALIEQIARICEPEGFCPRGWAAPSHRARGLVKATFILADIEPILRADERARVVAEATSPDAVWRGVEAISPERLYRAEMLAAIRAALGVEP
jgi:uncharacterized protein YbjT (DUF2867 family)